MTSLILAVTAHGAFLSLCVAMAGAFALLCGVIWMLRPVPVRTIPEAQASTQLALTAPIRMALPAAPARGCPQCGDEMATDQALGVGVGRCPSCDTVGIKWSGAA